MPLFSTSTSTCNSFNYSCTRCFNSAACFARVLLMLSLPMLVCCTNTATASQLTYTDLNDTTFRLNISNSQLDISIEDEELLQIKDMLLKWVNQSARTVQSYYGRFPVKQLRIRLQAASGDKVRFGQAFGGQSPYVRVEVGEHVNELALNRDWILVHEMVHLAMADVPRKHRWLLEGLATYVESVARVQMGYLDEEFVWRNFIQRMPQGLAKSGDRGLDHTPTWGRTYWGGAIFFLLADIEIRRLTHNEKSLRDALSGILEAGYSMQKEATAMQIFTTGDNSVGVPVLVNQYQSMRADPEPQELDSVWQKLGISLNENQVVYNDQAPLAWVRKKFFNP